MRFFFQGMRFILCALPHLLAQAATTTTPTTASDVTTPTATTAPTTASCPEFDKASSIPGWMSAGAMYRTLYSVDYSDTECKAKAASGSSMNYNRLNCATKTNGQKLCKRCFGDVLNVALFPPGTDMTNFDDGKFVSEAVNGTRIQVDSSDRCATKCYVLGAMSLRIGWHANDGPICGQGPNAMTTPRTTSAITTPTTASDVTTPTATTAPTTKDEQLTSCVPTKQLCLSALAAVVWLIS